MKIFVYGTLRDASVRKSVLGHPQSSKPACLKGFKMSFIVLEGISYTVIIEDPLSAEIIEGEYFEIDQTDLDNLDWYESTAYLRKEVELENCLKAWVYYRSK
jgi:gamma-glutamylcyclotransferase (GGCT)/AIG2-like uncharacterized protein YtfP